jgi:hypothetical protein
MAQCSSALPFRCLPARVSTYFAFFAIGFTGFRSTLVSRLPACTIPSHRELAQWAYWMLNSAAVRSFDRLAQEKIAVLGQADHLNRMRSYYAASERAIQVVKWLPALRYLAQHGEFQKSVKSLFPQSWRIEYLSETCPRKHSTSFDCPISI